MQTPPERNPTRLGPLSFAADYLNMTNDSIWHSVDRLLATPLLLLEMWKVYAMYRHVRPITFVCYSSALAVAVAAFVRSQEAQTSYDTAGFVLWHSVWHVYPLAAAAIMACDMWILGEYDAAADASATRAEDVSFVAVKGSYVKEIRPRSKLLSTVVMERAAASSSSSAAPSLSNSKEPEASPLADAPR